MNRYILTPRRYGLTTRYEAELRAEARRRRASWALFLFLLIMCGTLAVKLTAARHQIAVLEAGHGR